MLISINKISIKKVYYSEIVGLTLFIVISIWKLALSIIYNIIFTITINNSNRQKVMGIKYTQHKDISWSKRYRGKVALIHTKKIIWNRSFIEKEIDDINPKILKGPPKK